MIQLGSSQGFRPSTHWVLRSGKRTSTSLAVMVKTADY